MRHGVRWIAALMMAANLMPIAVRADAFDYGGSIDAPIYDYGGSIDTGYFGGSVDAAAVDYGGSVDTGYYGGSIDSGYYGGSVDASAYDYGYGGSIDLDSFGGSVDAGYYSGSIDSGYYDSYMDAPALPSYSDGSGLYGSSWESGSSYDVSDSWIDAEPFPEPVGVYTYDDGEYAYPPFTEDLDSGGSVLPGYEEAYYAYPAEDPLSASRTYELDTYDDVAFLGGSIYEMRYGDMLAYPTFSPITYDDLYGPQVQSGIPPSPYAVPSAYGYVARPYVTARPATIAVPYQTAAAAVPGVAYQSGPLMPITPAPVGTLSISGSSAQMATPVIQSGVADPPGRGLPIPPHPSSRATYRAPHVADSGMPPAMAAPSITLAEVPYTGVGSDRVTVYAGALLLFCVSLVYLGYYAIIRMARVNLRTIQMPNDRIPALDLLAKRSCRAHMGTCLGTDGSA